MPRLYKIKHATRLASSCYCLTDGLARYNRILKWNNLFFAFFYFFSSATYNLRYFNSTSIAIFCILHSFWFIVFFLIFTNCNPWQLNCIIALSVIQELNKTIIILILMGNEIMLSKCTYL